TPTLADGTEYDLGGEWQRIEMYGSLSDAVGTEITPESSIAELRDLATRNDVELPAGPVSHGKLVEELWEHFVGSGLYAPTFVCDFPVETSPLVRDHRTVPGVVEKWDLYV